MSSESIALITSREARALDDDLPPLVAALRELDVAVAVVDWDDVSIDFADFDLAVLRSTWDYSERVAEFLSATERIAARTPLHNPAAIVRWNTDKHYLADLARAGIAIVPSAFVEPGDEADAALDAFLAAGGAAGAEFVVKPCVGAGSRDAQRYARADRAQATAHIERLQRRRRSVLLQPYLERVDAVGETALIFVDGVFSHAIRKGALLRRGDAPTRALFASEVIAPRVPAAREHELAERTLAALPCESALLYARIDLIEGDDGAPRLLELELTEPSLFFAHAEGAATRFARALVARVDRVARGGSSDADTDSVASPRSLEDFR